MLKPTLWLPALSSLYDSKTVQPVYPVNVRYTSTGNDNSIMRSFMHQVLITQISTLRYLPIGGLKDFNQVSIKLAYGDNAQAIQDARVAAVQSLSGTGSCRLMAEFMHRWMPGSKVSDWHHPYVHAALNLVLACQVQVCQFGNLECLLSPLSFLTAVPRFLPLLQTPACLAHSALFTLVFVVWIAEL